MNRQVFRSPLAGEPKSGLIRPHAIKEGGLVGSNGFKASQAQMSEEAHGEGWSPQPALKRGRCLAGLTNFMLHDFALHHQILMWRNPHLAVSCRGKVELITTTGVHVNSDCTGSLNAPGRDTAEPSTRREIGS
jgi:hypothetical protein